MHVNILYRYYIDTQLDRLMVVSVGNKLGFVCQSVCLSVSCLSVLQYTTVQHTDSNQRAHAKTLAGRSVDYGRMSAGHLA